MDAKKIEVDLGGCLRTGEVLDRLGAALQLRSGFNWGAITYQLLGLGSDEKKFVKHTFPLKIKILNCKDFNNSDPIRYKELQLMFENAREKFDERAQDFYFEFKI